MNLTVGRLGASEAGADETVDGEGVSVGGATLSTAATTFFFRPRFPFGFVDGGVADAGSGGGGTACKGSSKDIWGGA